MIIPNILILAHAPLTLVPSLKDITVNINVAYYLNSCNNQCSLCRQNDVQTIVEFANFFFNFNYLDTCMSKGANTSVEHCVRISRFLKFILISQSNFLFYNTTRY